MSTERTPARKKAQAVAKYLRGDRPDYVYIFRYLREELEISVPQRTQKLPYVLSAEELQRYYQVVWAGQNMQDAVLSKLLMYTGVRVSELVNIPGSDVDLGEG